MVVWYLYFSYFMVRCRKFIDDDISANSKLRRNIQLYAKVYLSPLRFDVKFGSKIIKEKAFLWLQHSSALQNSSCVALEFFLTVAGTNVLRDVSLAVCQFYFNSTTTEICGEAYISCEYENVYV